MSDNSVYTLNHLSVYAVSGEDRELFLHGQLTNDVKKLETNSWLLAGYCTPKGRLIATIYIYKAPDRLLLVLPTDIAEKTIQRLRMFVMRSDVQIEQTELSAIASSHPIEKAKVESFKLLPANDLYLSVDDEEGVPNGQNFWYQQLIKLGLFEISQATQEKFIPQMVSLEKIGGVSFKKGCYPGQEIVARSEYLGKLKRHLYAATTDGMPSNGDSIYCGDNDNPTHCGDIALADDKGNCLLVLNDNYNEAALFLENGQPISLKEQAFSYAND